ncbi:MAG: glycosyltransferase family 2 protein [Candidatus Solibacter usitatus]|nr:glycosyltransferase family 2 protein [Candidatus Solibacter usitatus]
MVTAIIPTWNLRDLVCAVIVDLRNQSAAPEKILVVDNGSTDDTAEACERLGARVLRMGRNAGFSAAVNRGIAESSTEWVAVLNNDVRLECDWLRNLLRAAIAENAAFAGGKLLRMDDPGVIDGGYDLLAKSACAWRAGHGRADGPLWNQTRSISFVPFTAAIFRRELFTQAGPLDESFESYLEDVEFGLRCARKGHRGLYVPKAVARHAGSASFGVWSGETVRYISRNQVLLFAKHFPRRYLWHAVLGQLLWGAVATRHGAGLSWLRGKIEGLRAARAGLRNESTANILSESEDQLRKLQEQSGFDRMWRIYFALT